MNKFILLRSHDLIANCIIIKLVDSHKYTGCYLCSSSKQHDYKNDYG